MAMASSVAISGLGSNSINNSLQCGLVEPRLLMTAVAAAAAPDNSQATFSFATIHDVNFSSSAAAIENVSLVLSGMSSILTQCVLILTHCVLHVLRLS